MSFLYYKAINWNETEDAIDQYTWEKLTNNFWLDIRIPVEEDRKIWSDLTKAQQARIGDLLASASLNTALQSEFGAASLRRGIQTQQEEAVLNVTTFMESVHTKAFTTIYRALVEEETAASYYDFADNEPLLMEKTAYFEEVFAHGSQLQRKAAFILLETALTFGEYTPVLADPRLFQTNQMIGNILRGSGLYTAYLGYKFQRAFSELDSGKQAALTAWLEDFITTVMAVELSFLDKYGDELAPEAIALAEYGANYALGTMGFEARFAANLSPEMQSRMDQLLTTTAQLAQQSQIRLNSQLEAMDEDDYAF